ncbi:hypothetical protein V1478_012199 [Vespula squamosa]|uniref:Uncharacterized protein n=1 Tax=Vespula squamosa TaxID=30214 RepID=A0ABD2ACH9_VESSQ
MLSRWLKAFGGVSTFTIGETQDRLIVSTNNPVVGIRNPPTSLPLAPLLSSNGDPVRVVALALLPGALKGKGVVHASGSQRGRLVYGTVVTRYLPLRLMSAALLAFPRAKGITFYDILIETPEGSTKSMLYIAKNVVLSDKVQTDVDTRNILRVTKILSSRRVG